MDEWMHQWMDQRMEHSAKVIVVTRMAQRPKFFTESYTSNDGPAQRPKFFIVVIITFLKIIIQIITGSIIFFREPQGPRFHFLLNSLGTKVN